jgi:2-polyprenyl-3-methyl-5-hydroxy-6-metoxy-1,4-benzoquinol methylase
LLEIGCGPGNLLIPLAALVAQAEGIDHPDVVARARQRCRDERIRFHAGFFPDVRIEGRFNRVLAYGVIHILPDWPTLERFVDAAAQLVAPGGRLLLGDIPNADRKRRFLASDAGQRFDAEWKRSMAAAGTQAAQDPFAAFAGAPAVQTLDDRLVVGLLDRYQARGFRAEVLPQRPDLPFGNTREDILLERR